MTKASVFGETEKKKDIELKKIQFVHVVLRDEFKIGKAHNDPAQYDNVQLFKTNDGREYDLIIAWNNSVNRIPQNNRNIYLGHWNDGVV